MRILLVPHAYAPVRGGAESYCTRLGEALVVAGHEVHVFTADFASPEGFYQLGVGRVDAPLREVRSDVSVRRFPLVSAPYRAAGRLSPHTLLAIRRQVEARVLDANRRRFRAGFRREMESLRPDVVMALPHLFSNVRAVLDEHRRKPFPLVLVPMLHEEDPNWSIDDVAQALARADAVISLTDHEAHRLASAYGVPKSAVFTCSGGVELPPEGERLARSESVLFLGRKVLSKGLDHLVTAMSQVWTDHPSARLILAGSRAPRTDQVDHLVSSLPPESRARITSLDDVSEEVKHSLLSSARCVVVPSEIESLGLVALEAWAHRTPVVALDLPVFRELVEPGRNGLLVPPEDPSAMARAIRSLLADEDLARSLGEAGRRKAAEMTWESVATCAIHAYDHAVHSASHR